jgi:hypothetical protein
MSKKRETKAYKAVARMPAGMSHNPHNRKYPDFDLAESEVIQWIIKQPPVLQMLYDYYRLNKAIVFDPETKTWSGTDGAGAESDTGAPEAQETTFP